MAQPTNRKEIRRIKKRIRNIEINGHFGNHKSVTPFIWELRWLNGRRVYYAHLSKAHILLLYGGNKNGQNQDIKKANNVLTKNTVREAEA